MFRKAFCILLIIISASAANLSAARDVKAEKDLSWLKNWLSAWELISKEEFSLANTITPKMLFFDKDNVYTTSDVSAPTGTIFDGPELYGKKLIWKKAPHNGKLILPTGESVPVGLMSFAGPLAEGKDSSFFVMAAPDFWSAAGIENNIIGLDKMLTGVFLHEFAHTQQQNGFGIRVSQIEKHNEFKPELSDDIVQDYFEKDAVYVKQFNAESDKFYEAVFADNNIKTKQLVTEALAMFKKRHTTYFKGKKFIFSKLDNIFLSMEGLGQYAAVAWLINPKGGDVPFDKAVEGFRRKRNHWSQEEGLALFLILKKLSAPNWQKTMFSIKPVYVTALLEDAIRIK